MSEEKKGKGGFLSGLAKKFEDTGLHDAKVKAHHMKSSVGKFANVINPNHRHDEEHEQRTDEKRNKIADGHRFHSFAPERDGNKIKWYVDGRDYFHVSRSIIPMIYSIHAQIFTARLYRSLSRMQRRPSILKTGGCRPSS